MAARLINVVEAPKEAIVPNEKDSLFEPVVAAALSPIPTDTTPKKDDQPQVVDSVALGASASATEATTSLKAGDGFDDAFTFYQHFDNVSGFTIPISDDLPLDTNLLWLGSTANIHYVIKTGSKKGEFVIFKAYRYAKNLDDYFFHPQLVGRFNVSGSTLFVDKVENRLTEFEAQQVTDKRRVEFNALTGHVEYYISPTVKLNPTYVFPKIDEAANLPRARPAHPLYYADCPSRPLRSNVWDGKSRLLDGREWLSTIIIVCAGLLVVLLIPLIFSGGRDKKHSTNHKAYPRPVFIKAVGPANEYLLETSL